MLKWLLILRRRRLPRLIVAAVGLCAAFAGRAQVIAPSFPADTPWVPPPPHKPPKFQDQYPQAPSLPPALTIPLAPLHFSAPGSAYLLRRQSLVTLDFIDENRLLLSFQAPSGLKSRDADDNPAGAQDSTVSPDSTVFPGGGTVFRERQIRAMVVALPSGHVESETQWVVPDRSRYLWMLKDGHFLLRDSAGLEEGSLDNIDSTLKTAPSLRLPGRLLWLTLDPTLRIMITNSLEHAGTLQKSSDAGPPPQATASAPAGQQDSAAQPTLVARIFERESGQLIKTTRVPWTSQTRDWPFNSQGFLENVHDRSGQWILVLNKFAGVRSFVASVDSTCAPSSDYISDSELLITSCEPVTGSDILAVNSTGAKLWERRASSNEMWPLLVHSPDGSRFARETLILKRSANRYKRLVGPGDIQGQMVRVYDSADGNLRLEAPLKPMLDGGGNVAFSPSGRRVAILNSGNIQIFDLPAPATIPTSGPILERKY